MDKYTYEWQGFGILLSGFENGKTVWLQGEEASELYDQLEACENEEAIQITIDQYSEIAQ